MAGDIDNTKVDGQDENVTTKDESKKSMIEQIYKAITDVIGGNNPNQMFCMTFPGVVLDKKSYEYDISKSKPVVVKSNESKITNKLFDPCQITGADNGRQLATQYLSALDALTPKLNPNINKAKSILRDLLETSYSYTLDDGTKFNGTIQQAFYKLYEEWVLEKKKWNELQYEKQEELRKKYPGNTEEDSSNFKNEYLEWYEDVAESYLSVVEAKFGKILGVFSVNDMKIIEGILDSGVGAELEEAKEQVHNARKPNPDGGYTYPVTLEPADWFKYLDTDFDYIDLLESPDAYAQKYTLLVAKRDTLVEKISAFELKDQSGNLQERISNLKAAKNNFYEADKNLGDSYSEATIKSAQMLCGFINKGESIMNPATQQLLCPKDKDKDGKIKLVDWDNLQTLWNNISGAQTNYVNAAEALADAGMQEIKAEVLTFTGILKPLIIELDNVNKEIDALKVKIGEAISVDNSGHESFNKKVFPDNISKGYMQMTLRTEASSISKESDLHASSSSSTKHVNLFFGGYSQTSSSSSSVFDNLSKSEKTTIEIGCLVTKVNIQRNWFNPGVFLLSKDMFNTSNCKISNGELDLSMPEEVKKQLNSMNECIFPCYPTAFVIAKDVTINFEYTEEISQDHREAFEEHLSKGGGFFCFRGSSSASSSGEKSSSNAKFNGNTVTIRFPGPQILGYYLEFTPRDNSKYLFVEGEQQDTSITQFVENCKQILENFNNKNE